MTPEQISLVQTSFQKILPISETAASLFYSRLFEIDPSVRHLFKHDMQEQGRKLIKTLHFAVQGLNQPESIIPKVQELAKRHVMYGVESKHYDTVGAALLWTLEKGLGNDYTPQVKAAWMETYTLLAGVMRAA